MKCFELKYIAQRKTFSSEFNNNILSGSDKILIGSSLLLSSIRNSTYFIIVLKCHNILKKTYVYLYQRVQNIIGRFTDIDMENIKYI